MRRIFVVAAMAAAVAAGGCGSSNSQQTANDVSQGPGHGADQGSLYRTANLTKALDAMRKQIGASGQVTTFKLEPASIKSEIQKDGKAQTLIINSKFSPTPVAIGASVSAPFALNKIHADVPEKIVNALASKGVTLKDVDYFVVTDLEGHTRWLVYTTDNGTFQANFAGGGVKPLGAGAVSGAGASTTAGGGSVSASSVAKDAQKQASQAAAAAKSTEKSVQSMQDCVTKAGTDATALQKCASGG